MSTFGEAEAETEAEACQDRNRRGCWEVLGGLVGEFDIVCGDLVVRLVSDRRDVKAV